MKTLLILNDAPCRSERTHKGARLAGVLTKQRGEVRVFLIGDRSSLDERTQWTTWADKVLVF